MNGLFELCLAVCHFRMVQRVSNVLPALLREINAVAISIEHCPASVFRHESSLSKSLLKKWSIFDPPQRSKNGVKLWQYTSQERRHAWKTQTAAQFF